MSPEEVEIAAERGFCAQLGGIGQKSSLSRFPSPSRIPLVSTNNFRLDTIESGIELRVCLADLRRVQGADHFAAVLSLRTNRLAGLDELWGGRKNHKISTVFQKPSREY